VVIPGYFIYKEPIKTIRITKDDIRDYYWDCKENKIIPVDTCLLFELVESTKLIDTSAWANSEIEKFYLVDDKYVNDNFVIEKLQITDQLTKEFFRQQVKNINNPQNCDKGICKISRPCFDKTGQNAIMQFQYTTCENEGSFVIKFFTKLNQKWLEGLIIKEWRMDVTRDITMPMQ
jgi:hypothetical protein